MNINKLKLIYPGIFGANPSLVDVYTEYSQSEFTHKLEQLCTYSMNGGHWIFIGGTRRESDVKDDFIERYVFLMVPTQDEGRSKIEVLLDFTKFVVIKQSCNAPDLQFELSPEDDEKLVSILRR